MIVCFHLLCMNADFYAKRSVICWLLKLTPDVLTNSRFVGCAADIKFNDVAFGLWNFMEAVHVNGCRDRFGRTTIITLNRDGLKTETSRTRAGLETYKRLVSGTQCLSLDRVLAKFVNVSVSFQSRSRSWENRSRSWLRSRDEPRHFGVFCILYVHSDTNQCNH